MNTANSGKISKDKGQVKRRITQACILCRKKKIRCDGRKPGCVNCQDANLQCEYTEYKKRGPHKGYVRLLEERLVQLERKLISAGAELPPPITAIDSPSPTLKHGTLLSPSVMTDTSDIPPPDIVSHLIDLFFEYVNSVFPLVHRVKLKQAMDDGSVSKPLLWSVMAIAARFSNHPSIKTDPPYWAGERFARKATSLIDASTLEPTISNLQFWGIMSCLEYGRASGTKAYIYGGIAVRICYEMGLNKEEVLKSPLYKSDGTIDSVAMAFRRRIFWSCFCIDKFASASTNHPQGFDMGEYDAETATIEESRCLLDPLQGFTIDRLVIATDPLMDIIPYYLRVLEGFGEICKHMSKIKTNSDIIWPPIPEFIQLHHLMLNWFNGLPKEFHFTPVLLKQYRETSSRNYLNYWLCAHAMYCTGMLALHRGSLAYSDLSPVELPRDVYEGIQSSIQICKENVDLATDVFKALRDICGCNVVPYMGYCAYIFSTVLMTSAFSSDPASYSKSRSSLKILYDTIDILRPYWPMCERLANTTRDLIAAHSKLYHAQEQQHNSYGYEQNRINENILPPPYALQRHKSPDIDSVTSPSTVGTSSIPNTSVTSTITYPAYTSNNDSMISAANNLEPAYLHHQQQQQNLPSFNQQQLQQYLSNDIDFNSCEFLYDSTLFGQIIFDTTYDNTNSSKFTTNSGYMSYQPNTNTSLNNGPNLMYSPH